MKLILFKKIVFILLIFNTSIYAYKLSDTDIQVLKKSKNWLTSKHDTQISDDGTVRFKYGKSMPTVFCKPNNATSIELEAGEVIQVPKSGDSERWYLDIVTHKNNQGSNSTYILIKPSVPNLETNLLIYTNRRIYTIRLISSDFLWTPFVAFDYQKQQDKTINKKISIHVRNKSSTKTNTRYNIYVDSKWKPASIYNKYGKTYIRASKSSIFSSKLFIINKNKNQPISYQYKNGYIVVNAIIQNAILIQDGFFKKIIKIRRNK